MPKEIGSGKSTMQEMVMSGTVLLQRCSDSGVKLVIAVDRAINADLQDDAFQMLALENLKKAREEPNAEAKEGFLAAAQSNLEKAMELDFSDTTISAIKEEILPHLQTIDALKHEMLALQGKLARA